MEAVISVAEQPVGTGAPTAPATAPPMPHHIYLRLLSGFELVADGISIPLPLVAQRLLAYLAICERPMARSHLSNCLWPEKCEARAAANLRSTLWRLRQPGVDLVQCTPTTIGLRDCITVDIRDLTIFCRRAIAGTLSVSELMDFDPGYFALSGEILPDWYDDWLLIERERVRQLRLHATDEVCTLLVSHRRYADAIEIALAAVAAEPLRESSHETLISVHLAEGNRNEAILQFRRYREIVREGLGLEPSTSMVELIADLVVT